MSVSNGQISSAALQQIAALEAEKKTRTPAQQKIDCHLLDADRMRRGIPIAQGIATQRVDLDRDTQGRVLVDIKADVGPQLLHQIESAGGKVLSNFAEYHTLRASIPLAQVESLAAQPGVKFIAPAVRNKTSSVDSEGDYAHQANTARSTFNVNGAGVKVGVISDSVDYLSWSQINGLVTVLPGQSGVPNTGEGTAMLEIVHDLAPGAQLFFATANGSEAAFANNIRNLRFTYGCDIIVDDELYYDEPPFQDGIVAQAVSAVTADGALYFSSASNSGSKDMGTSGTWEGDFVDGGQSPSALESGRVHSFGGINYNTLSPGGSDLRADLFWADPLGASTNDYDLYVLDSTGSYVVAHSSNSQTGYSDPYEHVTSLAAGEFLVIVKYSGAGRFLHLSSGRGRLAISTAGSTRGHNCAANAFNVAATDARNSYPYAFAGGAANPVESYSSDGPRRVFFQPDGTPVTPGNFSSSGGAVRQKPDITAADGITTDVTGFAPFTGTSAAAPHAAAIAALLKSYNPGLSSAQIRSILTGTALDVMSTGADRDSGAGIVMALAALQASPVPARPDLTKGTDTLDNATPHAGDAVTASLTIANQSCSGPSATAGQFHIGFYWSTSSSFSGVTPFYEASLTGCSANGTVVLNQPITIDSGTAPGTYYLGYQIDDENEVAECNKNNNGIFYWTVTVQSPSAPPPAPLSIAGTAFLMKIADGTYPFLANSGYFLFWPAATGASFQMVGLYDDAGVYNFKNGSGTYSYLAVGASGLINLTDGSDSFDGSLAFTRTNSGSYGLTNTTSWPIFEDQTGQFEMFTGQALSSIVGKAFLCTIDDGHSPYADAGTFDFITASSGNSYSVFTLSGSGVNSSGSYAYSKVNSTALKLQLNDRVHGASTVYLVFSTPTAGAFVSAQPSSGGVQVGHFVLTAASAPTISLRGSGTISPNLLDATLTPGQLYSVTAKSAAGCIFAGWTGSIVTNTPALKFTMQSGMSLVANFIPNPFPAVAGTYNGLFGDVLNGISPQSAGGFTLTVTSKGGCSGNLQLGGLRYPFSGQFDATGYFQTTVPPKSPSLRLALQLDLAPGTDQVNGNVHGGPWTAQLTGNRAQFSAKLNPAPQAGKYTMAFSGGNDPLSEPTGNGWGTLTVDASGKTRFNGSLGDGTTISQAVTVSKDGLWPLYVPLNAGQGLFWGWITVTNAPSGSLSGDATWIKPFVSTAKLYPSGFALQAQVVGSAYSPPLPGDSALNLSNCKVVLTGGGLVQAVTNHFTVGLNGKTTSTNQASLTFTSSTGAFKGSMPNPDNPKGKAISFGGVVLQDQNCGRGWFVGTNQCGGVYVGQ